MNTRYPKAPELIATVRYIEKDDDDSLGDVVAGIQVLSDSGKAIAQIDLRQIDLNPAKNSDNLLIEIELHELVAALSLATLNSERN